MQRIQLAASEQFSATTNSFSAVWQPDRQVWLRRIDAMAEIILPGPSRAPETPFLGFWRSQELRAGGTQAVEGSAARRAAATTTLTAASRLLGRNPVQLSDRLVDFAGGPVRGGRSYTCTSRVESGLGDSCVCVRHGEILEIKLMNSETCTPPISPSGKINMTDQKVVGDMSRGELRNHLFVRLVAKARTFRKVDFRYSFFDTCYLRDCLFDSCDFTGCRFIGSNLHGSKFSGCKFDYACFERTLIDSSILDTECPGPDNLKLKFARTLRINYQQIGDAQSANKAIVVELEATQSHLYKAWHSNESYYRKKYADWRRLKAFAEWLEFKVLDLVWGNGESPWKLLRTTAIIVATLSAIDATFFNNWRLVESYISGLGKAPQLFFGTVVPNVYPGWYLTAILVSRLVMFTFFMSIVIKRFNRR